MITALYLEIIHGSIKPKKMLKKILNLIKNSSYALGLLKHIFKIEDPNYSKIFGNKFYFHDKPSFLITFDEIFQKGIYTFHCDNSTPVIIDCGANMGLSLLFFSQNYPNSTIYAFEPDNSVLDVLQKNIQTFEIKQVTLFKKAVWSTNGIFEFFTDKGMGGRIGMEYNNQTPSKVETIRLKDFIGDKRIDFLKMDIEGAEYNVIEDCEPILHQIENIFIEYHSIIEEEQKLDNILLILKRNGFRYHLSQSFSRQRPFIDNNLNCENMDLAINIYAYKNI